MGCLQVGRLLAWLLLQECEELFEGLGIEARGYENASVVCEEEFEVGWLWGECRGCDVEEGKCVLWLWLGESSSPLGEGQE